MQEKLSGLNWLKSKLGIKKNLQPAQAEVEQPRKKTIADVGFEILSALSITTDEKPALYNSLLEQARDMDLNNGGFSRFVSTNEAELFAAAFTALGDRPVQVITISEAIDLGQVTALLVAQFESSDKKPIIIVRGFDQEKMDAADPNWSFDQLLRAKVQNDGWVAFLQGAGRFKNQTTVSGSLSGSTSSSRSAHVG